MGKNSAHARYEELRSKREPFLRRARDAASVTLPYLFPPEGHTGDSDLPTPFQSIGSEGTNNLASKLLLALFPPNSSFFEITVDDFVVREMAAQGDDARAEIESALASYERAVVNQIEQTGSRNKIFEALKNLLVGGNVLVEILSNNRFKVTSLSRYVVLRDGEGTPMEIVRREEMARATLDPEVLSLLEASEKAAGEESSDKVVPLYTHVRREGKTWRVHQEVGQHGVVIPESAGTYPLDRPAFLPLRFIEVDGEDYGRGHVEEYLGDLLSLEKLSQGIVEFSAEAARIVRLVDPSGVTSAREVAEASTGDVLEGNAGDVTTLQLDKFPDFQVANTVAVRLEQRLERAFLLLSSIQRDGERVTAEEIRRLAEELEQALGGVYSLLAEELQAPLIQRIMQNMGSRLPKLPKELVNFKVVTGVAALGRNADLHKLDAFAMGVMELAGPESIADYIPLGDFFKRRAAALNLAIEIRSEDEVQQIRAQRQQAAMQQQAAGPAMTAVGQIAAEAAAEP